MRGLVTVLGLAIVSAAAACGSAGTEYVYNQRDGGNSVDNALPWPGGDTGFDNPGGSSGASGTSGTSGTSGSASGGTSGSSSGASSSGASSSGASSSGASSSGASSSGASSSGASSSGASSSGASSSGASSSGASSGTSGSTSGSSGTAAGGACGVCDRNWTCNGFTDPWTTQSGKCVNTRTTTALRCDGKFDQGGSVGVGTWTSTPTKLTLVYPMLGGGTKTYDCF